MPDPTLRAIKQTATNDYQADVIFVHGLADSPETCWTNQKGEKWHDWLADEHPNLAVWSLGYDVARNAWKGKAMPLADRAKNILALLSAKGIGERPICFIVHSMGGLLVKQMLRHALTINKSYEPISKATQGIIFFATPHYGSTVATLTNLLVFLVPPARAFFRPTIAMKDLEAHAPQLRELNEWYRNSHDDLNLSSRIFYETQAINGAMIVDESSADPGIPNITLTPIDADHLKIVKPDSKDSLTYLASKQFLQALFDPLDPS